MVNLEGCKSYEEVEESVPNRSDREKEELMKAAPFKYLKSLARLYRNFTVHPLRWYLPQYTMNVLIS